MEDHRPTNCLNWAVLHGLKINAFTGLIEAGHPLTEADRNQLIESVQQSEALTEVHTQLATQLLLQTNPGKPRVLLRALWRDIVSKAH